MVYLCIRQDSIPQSNLEKTLALMAPERRCQVERISHDDVRRATLCGEWLCKQMLAEQSGQASKDIRLFRDKNGKPQAENLPFHFNVSHSGAWVACAVSEVPIGIDLEVVRERDLAVARRICSPDEMAYIFDSEQDRLYRFLQVWTAKEAYVKLTGIGIKAMSEANYFDLKDRLFFVQKDDYILSVIEKTEL